MVPSWWRHRRDALRQLPSVPITGPAANRVDAPSVPPEHPPREGL
jgi:hypothetical protein